MRSTNPVLSRDDVFTRGGYATFNTAGGAGADLATQVGEVRAPAGVRPMTLDDVVSRTGLLFVIAAVTGGLAWYLNLGFGVAIGAALVGLVLVIVNSVKRTVSPPLIMAYAAVEGVFIGGISFHYEVVLSLDGIVFQAVLGTVAAFVGMLIAYRTGRIRVTPRFTKALIGATIGFLILAFANLLLAMFGVGGGTGIGLRSGPLGILFGCIGIVLACLFLALDFHMVEEGIKHGAPERESWLAAFGLTVTLVWLYLEILRVLAILRGSD